jgi:CheY-like chemotaxis protein
MPKHILCADDSITMQKVVAITFAHTDYQVTAARNVDEALALARQTRPDLVLADAVMPGHGKSGYDLAQALKTDPALARVPVVILVGNSQPYDEARGRQVGADGFLTKPWDTQVFIEKIGEILGRAASQGVAQAAGAARPVAPTPAPMPPRPTMTGNVPRSVAPAGAAPGAPPLSRPGAPPLVGRPSAPMAAQALPKPPAGLPRPPLIRNAPISGRPIGGAASQPIVQPAARLGDPRMAAARQASAPMAARPAPAPPAAAPPAPPPRSSGRQATIMGMPAVTMPPANTTPATAVPMPQPPPAAPPRPAAAAPPPAARPLPGSDALARAAQRVAAAGMTATQQAAEARGMDPRGVEYEAIAKLSREIIEQIAWEVVPELAEIIIRERLNELKK